MLTKRRNMKTERFQNFKLCSCMVSIIARQAQFAPWGNAMCVIKRLIVTDGYRVRKDFTIASCVGFRSDGLEDLALLIICVI